MSYGGAANYGSPTAKAAVMPGGGRNRYAEIMANYQQAQPYSFTSMPPSYSGGFTGYPSDYTGGFTPYQPPVNTQPINDIENIATVLPITGGGGGGGGYSSSPEGRAAREAPMSESDKAFQRSVNEGIAFGIDNLGKISPVATGLKALFGDKPAPAPVAPTTISATETYRGDEPNPAGYVGTRISKDSYKYTRPVTVNVADFTDSQGNFDFSALQRAGLSISGIGGGQGSSGGGYTVGGYAPDSPAAAAAASGTVGGYGPGTPGFNSGMTGLYKGGHVSMQHLLGPDPEGPDDGYAALKDGEFVINDKAVKKYGIELMNAINSGKISKGKLRGLLEM
jgi:hypothetical protein